MYTIIPAISGKQLIRLLERDGWARRESRRAQHGIALIKSFGDRTVVAIIPDTRASLPENTLHRILGVKQTGIRKKGMLELLNKYGV